MQPGAATARQNWAAPEGWLRGCQEPLRDGAAESPQEPLPTASRRRPRLPQHRPEWSPLPQVLLGGQTHWQAVRGSSASRSPRARHRLETPRMWRGFLSSLCSVRKLLLCRPPSSGGVGAAVLPGNRQASASETQALGSTQRRHGTPEVSSHPRLRTCPNTYFLE